eukprot:UN23180
MADVSQMVADEKNSGRPELQLNPSLHDKHSAGNSKIAPQNVPNGMALQRSGGSGDLKKTLKRQSSVLVDRNAVHELVGANDKLRAQNAKMRTELMLKSESLVKEKEKVEETEMQYEKILLTVREYEDRLKSTELENERKALESKDLGAEMENRQKELEELRKKIKVWRRDKKT